MKTVHSFSKGQRVLMVSYDILECPLGLQHRIETRRATGIIVNINDGGGRLPEDYWILVQFDEEFRGGHDGDGAGKYGYC
jgi:hypothetical protein